MFQNSVLNKYLNQIDENEINQQFKNIEKYRTQKDIILKMKEEEYQDGFLRDIFVDILGYILKPKENFNLVREKKKETDSKKVDGAILNDKKEVIAVIELKSAKRKDLTSIENQAFNYKNNFPTCHYIITSNFEKLRFYIDYSNEFLEFDLFNMTKEEFKKFYLLLNKENIFNDIPLKLKNETILKDEFISKELYNLYSSFKRKIFNNLVGNNPQYDKLLLFKKSQKLLDRFLFILFGEDKDLLPNNTISIYEKNWEMSKQFGLDKSLYGFYQLLFTHLDKGFKNEKYEIFAYNGGLFKYDEILDNPAIIIEDEILKEDILKLSAYDFNTEVDVNILGHIFEHSLNELEELTAELEGKILDKKKSKRKKDGVFYTPKYITKYIVENTIGKLCTEKKTELDVLEIDYTILEKPRKADGKLTKKSKELYDRLDEYNNFLLGLKIVDPACGSGAFLNEALGFLINEHTELDELTSKLTGDQLGLFNIRKSILENNLYGVDINEESVEIAKLALWLRTAEKGRKLSVLSGNIKCGNSLIDDPEVAGDKAFKWEDEFPEVFKNGGFDIVIGNPPYVGIQGIEWNERRYYESIYKVATGRFDLYTIFIEKAMLLKKYKGSFSFIVPGKILNNKQFKEARKIVCEKHNVKVLKIDDKVFSDAQVDSVVLLNNWCSSENLAKYESFNLKYNEIVLISECEVSNIIQDSDYIFRLEISTDFDNLIEKIEANTVKVKDIAEVKDGTVAGAIKDVLYINSKIDESCKKLYFGKHLSKYHICDTSVWINYKPSEMMIEEVKRKAGKRAGLWLRAPNIFHREKILTRFVGKGIIAAYDNNELYYEHTLHSTHIFVDNIKHKFLLALYNSKLINFYYKKTNSQGGDIFPQVRISSVEKLPIKIPSKVKQENLIYFVDAIIDNTKNFHLAISKFTSFLKKEYSFEKLNKKLNTFYDLTFDDFIKELKKVAKLKPATAKEKRELNDYWEEMFEEDKQKILTLKSEIDKTDKEIDKMVYELYELTDEEIKIVEEWV